MGIVQIILGCGIGAIFSLVAVVWVLAQFKICFTVPIEGEAQAIMRGKECVGFVWAYKGHKQLRTATEATEYKKRHRSKGNSHIKKWEIVPLEGNETDAEILKAELGCFNRALAKVGIRFYGIWPFYSIYRYEFGWTTVKTREEKDGVRTNAVLAPLCRKEWVTSVFLREYPYYSSLVAPTEQKKEGIAIRFAYLLFGCCTNPFTMLFKQTRWFDGATGITDQCAIHYLGSTLYKSVNVGKAGDGAIGTGDSGKGKTFGSWFIEELAQLKADFGLTVVTIRPFSKEPFGDKAKAFVESLADAETAERTGRGVAKKAEHEATANTNLARAEGVRVQNTTVAIIKAVEEAMEKVVDHVVRVMEVAKGSPVSALPAPSQPEEQPSAIVEPPATDEQGSGQSTEGERT